MSRTALIIGGGIAGLATGRALLAAGWRVQIKERASGLPRAGTALGMWPEAMAALDALGVGGQVRRHGVRASGGSLLRPDGRLLAQISPGEVYLISRPDLHRFLYSGLPAGTVTWGADVSPGAEPGGADLVIGADGLNSTLRSAVADRRVSPRALGTVAFRGVVPGPVEEVSETWGAGRLFGITPHDGQHTNWFASVRRDLLPASAGPDTDLAQLRALFGSWHPAVASVLDRVTESGADRRLLWDLPVLGSYVRGHTALVGDAAHAMAPNAGRGACEALIDAVALADSLGASGSIAGGLDQYDAIRRKPSQRVLRTSRLLNHIATMRRGTTVRNNLICVVSRPCRAQRTAADRGR